jgi:streptogramin lyase
VNPGVNIFRPDGTQVASFGTPTITSDFPGDVSVFADGTLAISDQLGDAIHMYDQSGHFVRTVNVPAGTHPLGSTVGADGILYVAGLFAKDILRIEADGTQLGSIALGFGPGEVVRAADGTLWVSDSSSGDAVHIKTDGTVLLSFAIGLGPSGDFLGLALAPDGNSLYVTRTTSTVVKQFDLSGSQIGQFDIVDPANPTFLTAASSSAAPEPSGLALAGIGAASLGTIAWRRRRKVTPRPLGGRTRATSDFRGA